MYFYKLFIYFIAVRWNVKDNRLYIRRLFEMTSNKLNNKMVCVYCNGAGYLPCRYCLNGCWRCNHSTLQKCFFCSGDGTRRYAYIKS